MATQSLEFGYTTGQTLTAKLFARGSDTVVATATSVTEATNRTGRYVAAFTDAPAADYLLVVYLGGSGAASEYYTLTLTTATFYPWSESVATATNVDDAEAAVLAAIAAHVADEALASSNSSTVNIKYLTRGDSYDGIGNPKLTWTVAQDFTSGWTGTMTIRHRTTGASLMSATVTAASSVLLEASLTTTDTAFALLVSDEEFGPHPYDVQMVKSTSQITVVPSGIAVISSDRTTA